MTFLETVRTIGDFGILIVIGGLVVYAIYLWITGKAWWIPKRENVDQLELTKREQHDKLLELRSDIGEEIQKLINSALKRNDWTRIQVIEFSNSVMSVAHLPFRYMTCTYETYKKGLLGTGRRIDRISTSLFNRFFTELNREGWYLIDLNCDDPDEICGSMCELMLASNETKSLNAALTSPSGKSIGYITVKNEDGFEQQDIDEIIELSHRIATLLCMAQ